MFVLQTALQKQTRGVGIKSTMCRIIYNTGDIPPIQHCCVKVAISVKTAVFVGARYKHVRVQRALIYLKGDHVKGLLIANALSDCMKSQIRTCCGILLDS